jgi:hypothetical protein
VHWRYRMAERTLRTVRAAAPLADLGEESSDGALRDTERSFLERLAETICAVTHAGFRVPDEVTDSARIAMCASAHSARATRVRRNRQYG